MSGAASDPPASEISSMASFLSNAFDAQSRGDSEHYDVIIAQLRSRSEEQTLVRLYAALEHFVPQLVRSASGAHGDLVAALLSYDGRVGGIVVQRRFSRLLISLVSANSTFFVPTVKALVLCLQLSAEEARVLRRAEGAEEEQKVLGDRLEVAHQTLRQMLELTPVGARELSNVLVDAFPYQSQAAAVLKSYVAQLLRVCRYAPSIRGELLEIIVDRCLQIDVEIKISDEGTVKLEPDANDFLDGVLGQKPPSGSTAPVKENGNVEVAVGEAAEKLDGMLELVFDYLLEELELEEHVEEEKADAASVDKLGRQILNIFEKRVLTTHKSKYVQFLFFVASARRVRLRRLFVDLLLRYTLDEHGHEITRRAATCYLASLVARGGSFVQGAEAIRLSRMLQGWLADYLRWHELGMPMGNYASYKDAMHSSGLCRQPDAEGDFRGAEGHTISYETALSCEDRHAVFFCVCQAMLYILCFRMKDVIEGRSGDRSDSSENDLLDENFWKALVQSKLQPLKYCLESVRKEFVYLCVRLDILPDETLQQVLREYPLDVFDFEASDGEAADDDLNMETADDRRDIGNSQRDSYKRPREALADSGDATEEIGQRKKQAVKIGVGLTFGNRFAKRVQQGLGKALPRKKHRERGTGGLGGGLNPLGSFFPFDPFLLERSHRFVGEDYTYWDDATEFLDDLEDDEGDGVEDEALEEQTTDDFVGDRHGESPPASPQKRVFVPKFREHKSRTNSIASEEDSYVQHEDVPVANNVPWVADGRVALSDENYRRPRNYSVASSTGENF